MKNGVLGDTASLIRRAASLRLAARQLAEGMKSGSFRSSYRGQGIEFSGVREYLRGDDIRAIDWNVTARMGRPFVKLFEEERELIVFLILDRSLSMQTAASSSQGTVCPSRLEAASEACALIAFACEHLRSPVGAVLFDRDVTFACAPRAGAEQTMLLLSRFDELPRAGVRGSALGNAITGAAHMLKKRSLVCIFSDFRAAGWEQPLALLAGRHDVFAVRVAAPADEELPRAGLVPFEDPETQTALFLPTLSPAFRRAWKEDAKNRQSRWHDACVRRGALALALSVSEDPVRALNRFFQEKRTDA